MHVIAIGEGKKTFVEQIRNVKERDEKSDVFYFLLAFELARFRRKSAKEKRNERSKKKTYETKLKKI